MKTLIELYDERAIENVLGPETFRPEKVCYLCPPEIARDRQKHLILRSFFAHRGLDIKLEFAETSLYNSEAIFQQMKAIAARSEDCALDVTGGTDAALFAAGMFCRESGIPTFTYSRKQNRFYNISNAAFADNLMCRLVYQVEDFFKMTGGTRSAKGAWITVLYLPTWIRSIPFSGSF